MTIRLTIDEQEIAVDTAAPLVDVAADHGIYIPTLCHVRGKPCLGACRVCSVRVDGHVMAACTVMVSDGMVVEVDVPELADMRKALVELLFTEGNHYCPSCEKSGRCDLQAVGYELGMTVARFPYRFSLRRREVGDAAIWLERDRCIFCQRCVEFVRDRETGRKIFAIAGHGAAAHIVLDDTLAAAMPPEQVAEAAALCPVGCILIRGKGFDAPIGQRKYELKTLRERTLEGQGE
jgi:[NiFe] hydrogenase diaphorase moiety small subunit